MKKKFGLSPFETPETWDIYAVGEHYSSSDAKIPYSVSFYFGKKAKENNIDLEKTQDEQIENLTKNLIKPR